MYSLDPIFELELARQRQKELDRQLALRLLIRQATDGRPKLANRALTNLGDTLVDLGLRLRERYAVEAMSTAR